MLSYKASLITFLYIFSIVRMNAQELNCMVSVSTPKIEGTDRRVFETLQTAMYEFINNRKWTNFNVAAEERIECTFLLTINDRLSTDEFRGTLNVVLRRPVFNSAYNTVLLNYIDKGIQFKYVEYQPLDYSDGSFTSNLTSLLAYYSYTVLGFYFDSFSPSGGTPFFEKAQEVVNAAQNSSEPGWKAFESDKNRWWLVNNYLNPANSGLRDFAYGYNRQGLDMMYEKVDQGRASITQGIDVLQKIYNLKPNLFALQLIYDAKRDEIINIYSDQRVPPMEKTNVVNILKEIDPSNSSKYQVILDSK
ncbi:MAG: DUF4835 family protein [Bacteroidota bacterium]